MKIFGQPPCVFPGRRPFSGQKKKKKKVFLSAELVYVDVFNKTTNTKKTRHEKQIELNLASDDSLSRRLTLSPHSFPN